ncbi:MAG TPA: flagellar hook-associated protein FlgK [Rhizomicrobium sp.]
MSINSILASAMTALQTNTAALKVVSDNVANINTQGYSRRVVNQTTQVAGGGLTGVDIADIQRITDQFLQSETLSASAGSAQYSAQSDVYSQLNGLLGSPGDGNSLGSQLDNIFSALATASQAPNTSTSQQSVLTALQGFANTINSTSSSISSLQSQVDGQISSSISSVNSLTKNIYNLNQQIQTATLGGDTSSGLLDQRDLAVQQLSSLIGVRTSVQANGQMTVMTQDGVDLVGDSYAQLSYAGGNANGTYGQIMMTSINGMSGKQVGQAQAIDPHLGSGSIEGLIDMRDNQLPAMQNELGNLARQTALAFNAQSNANSAAPPPSVMSGRDTGLLATDSLNFSGKTTIAVADSSGNLVSRIDVDFGAGTLSVDGAAPPVSIGTTVGSFASALNGALGSNGSASFSSGQLSIAANGTNGVVVQDDATTPSSRGGAGFSLFFGLNDVFEGAAPSILSTGLSASDSSGLAAGGSMSFVLKNPNGTIDKQASVTIAAGMSIGDVVTALNTSFGGAGTFALGSDGSMKFTPSGGNSSDTLNVTSDTTQRGNTGMSFTGLFGIGANQAAMQAQGFSVNASMISSPSSLPFAQSNLTSTTVAGDSILGSGDARGLIALQNLANSRQNFTAAGGMGAQTSTLTDYAANFYQDVATRSNAASTAATTQGDRLSEAQTRQSSESGVNLDEELSNMMTYQRAYSAGARMLQVGQTLYDTLLQMPV